MQAHVYRVESRDDRGGLHVTELLVLATSDIDRSRLIAEMLPAGERPSSAEVLYEVSAPAGFTLKRS